MQKKKWVLLVLILLMLFTVILIIVSFNIPITGFWEAPSNSLDINTHSEYFKFKNGKIDIYILKDLFKPKYIEDGLEVSESTGETSLIICPCVARYKREGRNQYKVININNSVIDNRVGRIRVGFFSSETVYNNSPQTIYKAKRVYNPFTIYTLIHKASKLKKMLKNKKINTEQN